ncbi:hypothetical protein [Specibacter cremeus]|uniref:hypothetical protein n=1 Tax=Specibacter cremeus TaxID=1629051 RepID=UPI000F77F61D|nr:hypothetical protein [Specibacter cremeus]
MRATRSPRTTTAARLALGLLGTVGIGYGLWELVTHLPADQLAGLIAWLGVALLLHDGVLVPLTTVAGRGLKRITHGLGALQQAIIRGALVCGCVMTLIVAPLLGARAVLQPEGPASAVNRTILQGAYGASLLLMWLGLALAAAAGVAAVGLHGRRKVTKTRP